MSRRPTGSTKDNTAAPKQRKPRVIPSDWTSATATSWSSAAPRETTTVESFGDEKNDFQPTTRVPNRSLAISDSPSIPTKRKKPTAQNDLSDFVAQGSDIDDMSPSPARPSKKVKSSTAPAKLKAQKSTTAAAKKSTTAAAKKTTAVAAKKTTATSREQGDDGDDEQVSGDDEETSFVDRVQDRFDIALEDVLERYKTLKIEDRTNQKILRTCQQDVVAAQSEVASVSRKFDSLKTSVDVLTNRISVVESNHVQATSAAVPAFALAPSASNQILELKLDAAQSKVQALEYRMENMERNFRDLLTQRAPQPQPSSSMHGHAAHGYHGGLGAGHAGDVHTQGTHPSGLVGYP